jgi:hypothetical protein
MNPIDTNTILYPPENNPFIINPYNTTPITPSAPPLEEKDLSMEDKLRRDIQVLWRNNSYTFNSYQLSSSPPINPDLPVPTIEPSIQNKNSLSESKVIEIGKEELNEIIEDENRMLQSSNTLYNVAAATSVIATLTFFALSLIYLPPLFPLSLCLLLLASGVSLTKIIYFNEYRDFSFNGEKLIRSNEFYDFLQDNPDKAKLIRSRHFEPLILAYREKLNLESQKDKNGEKIKHLKEKNAEKIKNLIEHAEKEEKDLQEDLDSQIAANIARLEAKNRKITDAANNPYYRS